MLHNPASRPCYLLPRQGSQLLDYFLKNFTLQAAETPSKYGLCMGTAAHPNRSLLVITFKRCLLQFWKPEHGILIQCRHSGSAAPAAGAAVLRHRVPPDGVPAGHGEGPPDPRPPRDGFPAAAHIHHLQVKKVGLKIIRCTMQILRNRNSYLERRHKPDFRDASRLGFAAQMKVRLAARCTPPPLAAGKCPPLTTLRDEIEDECKVA